MANTKSKETNIIKKQGYVAFAAIDKYVESNIISSKETTAVGRDFVIWGDSNIYPNYLYELSKSVSTLKSVIGGSAQFVCGDKIVSNISDMETYVNKKEDTWADLVENIARDYFTYGGFAINVLRNKGGQVSELYYVNLKNLRSDKENNQFFYSEDWSRSYGRVKYIVYPKFTSEGKEPNSIYFYKNDKVQCYPSPIWEASVKSAETEKKIDEYHLNNISNNFSGTYIVNFNNGQPSDQQKEEIEEDFNEKFTGVENSGNVMMTWNDSKENETTITKIASEDFGAKYDSLSKRVRQSIFTSFRATPNLFGIPTETTGFSEQEYNQAFKLYNRTQIRPIQSKIVDAIDKIMGRKTSITIVPFTLENKEEKTVE